MKNPVVQFSMVVLAFVALAFVMGYTKPMADEPKQYIVVHDRFSKNLEDGVNQKISEGWHCQGGVSFYGVEYAQAMVK